MSVYIHALVQDADDDKAVFGKAVEHEMGSDRILEVSLPDIYGTPGLPARCQFLERLDDGIKVAVRLLQRPVLEGVEPDFLEVGFRPWRKPVSVTPTRHA